MNRVSTISLQRTMALAIQESQQQLAVTQQQLASGKKAQSYADLGTETSRNLSARSMVDRQEAQAVVAKRVGTTMEIYDAHTRGIEDSMESLRQAILTAVGTENGQGLDDAIQSAFENYRNSLNASEAGVSLFAGSRSDQQPFQPTSLTDVAATPLANAFTNDQVKASANVADGINVTYGILASDVGGKLYEAFQSLAAMGSIGNGLSDADKTALTNVVSQLETGLSDVRNVVAENGRRQARMDVFAERADARRTMLEEMVSANEDADLAEVALKMNQQRTALEASYSVFAKLANLNLTKYLS